MSVYVTDILVPAYLVVLGFALLLFASVRPHPALVTLAVLSPLLTALRLLPGIHVEALSVAAVSGAAIAAARPRRTTLRAQSPTVAVPALLFAAAVVAIAGIGAARLAIEGTALSFVAARHARDGVMRPIHLIWAAGMGGFVAVAFSTHDEGAGGAAAVFNLPLGVLALAALLWMLIAFTWRVIRALKANPWDRALIGSIAALTLLLVVWIARSPFSNGVAIYPFAILLGATIARADGDAQPPLGDVRM